MARRRAAAPQPSSPIFKLPAELRIAIYEHLDFPPIDNNQCRGIVLSCRQAKSECQPVAFNKCRTWLATNKKDVLSQCGFGVRILIPAQHPITSRFSFGTIREIKLVFPGRWTNDLWTEFFDDMRHLNPILGLWLDKLTLHFIGPTTDDDVRPSGIVKSYRRLLFIIEGGLTYGHDAAYAATQRRKYAQKWTDWKPEPSFIKKLVISWDLTDNGLASDEMVLVGGICKKRHTRECRGRRMYRVFCEDHRLGELMYESECRFRPSDIEAPLRMRRASAEHLEKCISCKSQPGLPYRRYARGLPEEDDHRWI
jgi:hypothetical protein